MKFFAIFVIFAMVLAVISAQPADQTVVADVKGLAHGEVGGTNSGAGKDS